MSAAIQKVLMVASAILMIVLQPITFVAMVIAPMCTGIAQQASAYKIASIVAFSAAYYFLAWRRASLILAIAIPAIQIALGWFFLGYINSLPMTCS